MYKLFLLILPYILAEKVAVIEDEIINEILVDYNDKAYPGTTEKPGVIVRHALSAIRIVEFNTKKLVLDSFESMEWNDPRLTWSGNPSTVRIPSSDIWLPDIVMYNNLEYDREFEPRAVIRNSGDVYLVPPSRLETRNCKSTADGAVECSFKFGSWTYDAGMIDLNLKSATIDMSGFEENDIYEVLSTKAERKEQRYSCCPESYVDVTYTIKLKPKQEVGHWFIWQ